MKISRNSAQNAKDQARSEKQRIMRDAGKRLTREESTRMRELNEIIKEADKHIEGRNDG